MTGQRPDGDEDRNRYRDGDDPALDESAAHQDTRKNRRDAEHALEQILQEVRVIQTGVQILSAFLLTLPFTTRFSSTTGPQKAVYAVTLISAAVTTALVIAPVSYHRRQHEGGDGEDLRDVVTVAVRLARYGMASLLVAAVSSAFLAVDVAIGTAWAVGLSAALTVVYIYLWYCLPLSGHWRH
jgi:hypothetical protein